MIDYNLVLYVGTALIVFGFVLFLVSEHFERQADIKLFRQEQLTKSFKRNKEIGKGQVIGWTLELSWSNGVVERHGECDDTCASEVDNYLTELEKERNE